MKIKSKLGVGLVSILVFLLVPMAGLFMLLQEVEKITGQIVEDRYERVYFLTVAVGIILSLWVGISIIRGITRNLKVLLTGINDIANSHKDKLPQIELNTNDEISEIATALNVMAGSIEEKLQTEYQLRKNMEDIYWAKDSVIELTTVYQGVQNIEEMALLFITKLTPLVGASYGVFYLGNADGESLYRKVGSYAYNGHDVGSAGFAPGEGLVGQCARENRTILISEAPENYIRITSGLGEAKPASIIVLPVPYEDQVIGVIELATFKEFNEYHFIVFEHALNHFGVAVKSVTNFIKAQQLLEESRTLTEELQSQSEELQMQQEELRSINEELQEQNRESQEKNRELELFKGLLENKNDELTQISKYKSDFLANMSHELRTPLNSLLILSQMLSNNQEGNLNAEQVKYAQTICDAGKDLLELINNILDLSKIESGKMDVNIAEIFLKDIESSITDHFRTVAEKKGLQFEVRFDLGLPETILTDDQKLKQILNNLLSNAIKFTEKGHVALDVRMPNSEKDTGPTLEGIKSGIIFSVSDTGIGIPQEKMEVIFQSFEQADNTIGRKFGGTGLGLSVSLELTQLLGGVLTVSSKEGQGSVFILYLPIVTESADKILAEQEVATELDCQFQKTKETSVFPKDSEPSWENDFPEGKKVLVVDDDMRNIFALTAALEGRGVEVVFAENGRQALEVLKENRDVNLILMDIMMPEMDGYQTIEHIRQIPEFSKLPIIALTAKAMKGDRQKCIDSGASDYICKPVDLDQLFSLMLVWLYK